jgi:pyrroline-5-carboxylate reductase
MTNHRPTIGFIGGGNMAASLIGGLINAGYSASDITVSEPDQVRRESLSAEFGIRTCTENNDVLSSQIIILAVKPQLLKMVCQQLSPADTDALFISIAAGIKSTDIDRWLHDGTELSQDQPLAIVRCMPNTPSLLQCGASGLYANKQVSATQRDQAQSILEAVGIVSWVETETQLNAVTAVSGSGPAYYFLMMEAMQQAGEKLGLSAEVSRQLVLQTALGAARMAVENDISPAELRKMVTSKGGTTEQAILSFQSADFEKIVEQALQAANDRSISLADELGSE